MNYSILWVLCGCKIYQIEGLYYEKNIFWLIYVLVVSRLGICRY